MKTHPAILASAAILISIFFTLLLLELALRLFPVQSYVPLQPVTKEDPLLHFEPNRKFTYSAGWDFDAKAKGRTNAQGWVNDQDYAEKGKPVIAIVGDSYIQASMVEHGQTIQGRLQTTLNGSVNVYSFGIGGSPLSQYLIFAAHARDTYKPVFMVVNIVSNDFDESLPQYKNKPRFHYFVPDENGDLKPQLIGEYKPSVLKGLIAHSALVRYFYFHMNLADTYNKILFKKRNAEQVDFVSNVAADASQQKIDDSKKAIDAFLDLLPDYAGLPKDKIILIIDGIRTDIYAGTDNSESYFGQMRAAMIDGARARGYTIIDMHPVFEKHYADHHQKFEFTQDAHWNALAHELAAREIMQTNAYKRFTAQ